MDKLQIFSNPKHGSGGWWWHLRAGNGKILATGHEPFASSRNALRAAKRALKAPDGHRPLLVSYHFNGHVTHRTFMEL